MQTTALASQAKPCTDWCTNHEATGDICFAEDMILKTVEGAPWQVREIGVGLAAETTGATIVTLAVNGYGMGELSLDYAEQIAMALAALVAAGRRAGAR